MAKYRVTGAHPVNDTEPGGTVELEEHDAARLVSGGHVEPLTNRKNIEPATITNSTEEQES